MESIWIDHILNLSFMMQLIGHLLLITFFYSTSCDLLLNHELSHIIVCHIFNESPVPSKPIMSYFIQRLDFTIKLMQLPFLFLHIILFFVE